MYKLAYYDYRIYVDSHEEVPDDVLEALLGQTEHKMLCAVFSCQHLASVYTIDENIEYFTQLINKINDYFSLNLTDIEKKICIAYVVSRREGMCDIKFIEHFGDVMNVSIDEENDLWLLHQDCLSTLLFLYNQISFDVNNVKYLLNILRLNKDLYDKKLQEYRRICVSNVEDIK